MSDTDGAGTPHRGRAAIQVPCLHNPGHHEVDFHLKTQEFMWIDLEGPDDEDLQRVADQIGLHPLTLKDAKTFDERAKIEDYDDYVFMVVYGVDPRNQTGEELMREFHIIVAESLVVTIHRHPHHGLDQLRQRHSEAPVRSKLFLVYEILDVIVSTFEPVLSAFDEVIDTIEEQVIARPRETHLKQIFSLKRGLVEMRREISPMRDMFLRRADHIAEITGDSDDDLYFRDLYDSLIRTSEMVDAYRDLLSGATDLYLSTVANRQGEVNRQLTIIATVFLPLTFFTGFFGQNFTLLTTHLLTHDWAFWVFGIGILVISIAGFWWWFRRKGWSVQDATCGAPRVE